MRSSIAKTNFAQTPQPIFWQRSSNWFRERTDHGPQEYADGGVAPTGAQTVRQRSTNDGPKEHAEVLVPIPVHISVSCHPTPSNHCGSKKKQTGSRVNKASKQRASTRDTVSEQDDELLITRLTPSGSFRNGRTNGSTDYCIILCCQRTQQPVQSLSGR